MTKPTIDLLPKARHADLVVRDLDDETIIYDKQTQQATCLNQFAAQVWSLCDGQRSISDIVATLDIENGDAEVQVAIEKLSQTGLLTNYHDLHREDRRRFVIGTSAGLASLVTLSVPSAAAAASCLGLGSSCTSSDQCCGFAPCVGGVCV